MPTYQYRNEAGETFEFMHSIKHLPPEKIVVFPDGSWQDATTRVSGTYTDPKSGQTGCCRVAYMASLPTDRRVYTRQITGGGGISVPDYVPRPNKTGLPVSRAAPRRKGGQVRKVGDNYIREHSDGVVTNLHGQPIIDSNEAARRVAKATGMDLD